MSCPICGNKPMNCDCTSLEKEQFYEIEDLSAEVEKLRDWQKRAVFELINSLWRVDSFYRDAMALGSRDEGMALEKKRIEQLIEEAK